MTDKGIDINLDILFSNCLTNPDICFEIIRLIFPKKDDLLKNLETFRKKFNSNSTDKNEEIISIILENMNDYFFFSSKLKNYKKEELKFDKINIEMIDLLKEEYFSSFDFGILMLKIFDFNFETIVGDSSKKWILWFKNFLNLYRSDNKFNKEYFITAIYYLYDVNNEVGLSNKEIKNNEYFKNYTIFLKTMIFFSKNENNTRFILDDYFQDDVLKGELSEIMKTEIIESPPKLKFLLNQTLINIKNENVKKDNNNSDGKSTKEYKKLARSLRYLFYDDISLKGVSDVKENSDYYSIRVNFEGFGYQIETSEKSEEPKKTYIVSIYDNYLLTIYIRMYCDDDDNSVIKKIIKKYKAILFDDFKDDYQKIMGYLLGKMNAYKKEEDDIIYTDPTEVNKEKGEVLYVYKPPLFVQRKNKQKFDRRLIFLKISGINSANIKKITILCHTDEDSIATTFNLFKNHKLFTKLNSIDIFYAFDKEINTLRYPLNSFSSDKQISCWNIFQKNNSKIFYAFSISKSKKENKSYYSKNIVGLHGIKRSNNTESLNPKKKIIRTINDRNLPNEENNVINTTNTTNTTDTTIIGEKTIDTNDTRKKTIDINDTKKKTEPFGDLSLLILKHYMDSKFKKLNNIEETKKNNPFGPLFLLILKHYVISKQTKQKG